MTTTRFLATALPYSLADDAPWHVSVFVTHRLTPDGPVATLADFPAARAWVATLQAGTLHLATSNAPEGIEVEVVSEPDADAWAAVFPPDTPVRGFPTPKITGQDWHTYPAHTVGEHALDLHLASAVAFPLAPPPVASNPALKGVLGHLGEIHPAVRTLVGPFADARAERDQQFLARKLRDAEATLAGPAIRGVRYDTKPVMWTSAIEHLLEGTRGDAEVTDYLDSLLGQDLSQSSAELRMLRDVHAARRFYQRESYAYQRTPDPDHVAERPEVPDLDFHEQAASYGSTPALLRRLGLVVDVRVADGGARDQLAGATWIAARLTPPDDADAVALAAPRVWCEASEQHFRAVSSPDWVGGALPLGDPEIYAVLDLDPDASGLKLEQFLRSVPRTLASELNGDRASGAPGSLRSTGFSIARTDRADRLRAQIDRVEQFTAVDDEGGAAGPDLIYDDVVRGLRLEVWDDVTGEWHSLHEQRVDVTADGTLVLDDAEDLAFLQHTGLTRVPGDEDAPYYLHEVFVGWDGWSLAAPRPGKVIVHGDGVNGPVGQEVVLDEPLDDPAGHVHIRSRVQPGSLPWLRYGRSYSFRVRGVDLAGNSVPRPARPSGPDADTIQAADQQLQLLRETARERVQAGLLGSVRDAVLERVPAPEDSDASPFEALHETVARIATGRSPGGEAERGDGGGRQVPRDLGGQASRDLGGRLGDARAERDTGGQVARERAAEQLEEVQRRLGETAAPLRLPDLLATRIEEIDSLLLERITSQLDEQEQASGEHAAARQQVAEAIGRLAHMQDVWRHRPQLDATAEVLAGIDDTFDPFARVTDLSRIPGLRQPPRIPRPEWSRRAPVVTTPRPFLRWHPVPPPTLVLRRELGIGESLHRVVIRDDEDSQRHVVPPKTSQLEAEQHGQFDEVMGSSDPDVHVRLYATALRERGTLLDEWIQDLDDANGVVQQPGIALHARPGADPDAMVTLADITANRDTPLGEGQYVVHDTDQLVLPYLPDPAARGIALVFYDAGAPHLLPEPRVLQTVVLPFAGDWPEIEPLRLVVAGGEELGARLQGNELRIEIPAGEQIRAAISSSLDEDDLDVFGVWRSHLVSTVGTNPEDPEVAGARAVIVRAATSGWFWWLTPSEDLRLVHAVPRPVRPPELLALRLLQRPPGLTVAALTGIVDVHGPSTDRLTLEASWTEWVDDLATDGPQQIEGHDVVTSSPVQPDQRYGLFHLIDAVLPATGDQAPVVAHKAIQSFPDTHHRTVTYAARGVTRYAEFFAPDELPAEDDPSLLGEPVTLTVPSSVRPAAPEVTDTVPLLLWEQSTEPDQPFALRRTRRSGVRIWLRRPWFSSGDGELLGVVLGAALPHSVSSRWAKDPALSTAAPASTAAPPLLSSTNLVIQALAGASIGSQRARPVRPPATLKLLDISHTPTGVVFGYRPEYHPGRGQWFVDVALDPGPSLWPFVRLAVARYQPDSLTDCELSPVVMTDWAQPLPERTATLNRPSATTARVTLTGPIAMTPGRRPPPDEEPTDRYDAMLLASRAVCATVQTAPGDGGGDLDWVDHARVRLPLVGLNGAQATWTAELPLPEPVEPATPGTSTQVRVLVEELEFFDADPASGPKEGQPSQAERLVYADHLPL